jgi:hypothetical protein
MRYLWAALASTSGLADQSDAQAGPVHSVTAGVDRHLTRLLPLAAEFLRCGLYAANAQVDVAERKWIVEVYSRCSGRWAREVGAQAWYEDRDARGKLYVVFYRGGITDYYDPRDGLVVRSAAYKWPMDLYPEAYFLVLLNKL